MRKITVDNGVRYNPIAEKTEERDVKAKTVKGDSLPRKQNKNFSQNNKKFLKNISAQGFKYLK